MALRDATWRSWGDCGVDATIKRLISCADE
jgi:hypothetical protein